MSKKGIVYKIVVDDKVYVGSTVNLQNRQNQHNHHLKNELSKDGKSKIYKYAREKGVQRIVCIPVIQEFKYNETWELRQKEEETRAQLQAELNSVKCFQSKEEREAYVKDYNEVYGPIWREENKEYVKEYNKEYREQDPQKKKDRDAEYYQENKEEIIERTHNYYHENKEEINRKGREKRANETPEQKKERNRKERERMAKLRQNPEWVAKNQAYMKAYHSKNRK